MDQSPRNNERGAIVALLGLLLPVVILCLGLVVDIGAAYTVKRDLQTAADAAALAAMQELRGGNPLMYSQAALEDAGLNGYTDGDDTTIEVNRPPLSGPRLGNPNFVEVIVRTPSPRYFTRSLGGDEQLVAARAVAGVAPTGGCVVALNQSASKSFWATGSASVNTGNCGVLVNSAHAQAAVTNGSASVTSPVVNIVGGYSGNGFSTTPNTGVGHFDDPLAEVAPPTFPSCTFSNTLKLLTDITLVPGVYCGGIEAVGQVHVTLLPGTYVIRGGGIKLTGGSTMVGLGVTFYLTEGGGNKYGEIDFHGNATVVLSAPTTGPLKGILFFEDRDVSPKHAHKISGSVQSSFNGVMYFSRSEVELSGGTNIQSSNTVLVADKIKISGNASLVGVNDSMAPPALSTARIVE